MSVTVVVGGLRGDEDKAKLVGYLALADQPVLAARAGRTPDPEHLIELPGQKHALRNFSAAFIHSDTRLVLGPGALIDPALLLEEVERLRLADRVGIDFRCGRVDDAQPGSVRDVAELQRFLADVPLELYTAARNHQTVLVEGVYGLAYTSDEGAPSILNLAMTAQACCVQTGLGPTLLDQVIVVLPAHQPDALAPNQMETADQPRRLVGFDLDAGRRAVQVNGATQLALVELEKRFTRALGATRRQVLPNEARQFIDSVEDALNTPVALVSTGPLVEHVVDLR